MVLPLDSILNDLNIIFFAVLQSIVQSFRSNVFVG